MAPQVFICHANEDKQAVARPLAEALVEAGLRVWYDEFSLKAGDSISRMVERGLKESEYGVVILSPRFVEKKWPRNELAALFAHEELDVTRIIPVWHGLGLAEVKRDFGLLADRKALLTSEGLDSVVRGILDIANPTEKHYVKNARTSYITPEVIDFHSGEWLNQFTILVANSSSDPMYHVGILGVMENQSASAGQLVFRIDNRGPPAGLTSTDLEVVPDLYGIFGRSENGNPTFLLWVHTIRPHESRQIAITPKKDFSGQVKLSIAGFQTDPPRLLVGQEGEVALPMAAYVGMNVEGFFPPFRRRF